MLIHMKVEDLKNETYEPSEAEAACVDGIPVSQRVYDFAMALRKAMPGVKFGICDSSLNIEKSGKNELWVYYPGHEYCLGFIGHGDYSINEVNNVYAVYSRKVANRKINLRHKQHNMLQSANMDKAIKNAKRALLPYTNQEIATQSITTFAASLREVVSEAENEALAYIHKCRNDEVMIRELRHLIALDVKFVTPEFQAAATQFLTSEAEAREKKTRLHGAYFVRMYERPNGTHVDILTFSRTIREVSSWNNKHQQPVEQTTLQLENLPKDIELKIATLSMMDVGTYVPLVGLKASTTSFWIERETA